MVARPSAWSLLTSAQQRSCGKAGPVGPLAEDSPWPWCSPGCWHQLGLPPQLCWLDCVGTEECTRSTVAWGGGWVAGGGRLVGGVAAWGSDPPCVQSPVPPLGVGPRARPAEVAIAAAGAHPLHQAATSIASAMGAPGYVSYWQWQHLGYSSSLSPGTWDSWHLPSYLARGAGPGGWQQWQGCCFAHRKGKTEVASSPPCSACQSL